MERPGLKPRRRLSRRMKRRRRRTWDEAEEAEEEEGEEENTGEKKQGLLQLVAEWIRRVLRHALGFWHTEGWRGDSFRCRAGRRNSKKASKLKRQSKEEETHQNREQGN